MAISTGKKGALVSEINVTPFVDVMLVLLIIFMVTAPLMTLGFDVDLPKTKTVDVLPTDSDHLVLSVSADGKMYLDEYAVDAADLEEYLKTMVKEKDKQLFLQADRSVPYGTVVEIMGRAKAAGIDNIGIVAEPQDETALEKKK